MTQCLQLISKYRSAIMGFAICWVVFTHCYHVVNLPLFLKFPIFGMGFGGVDIFLFVSGFGIYCSLNKNKDIGQYLIRRIKRFLPSIPIFLFFCLATKVTSFHTILGYLTLENFWCGKTQLAFLSYVFLCYVLSPIFVDIIEKHLTSTKNKILFILFIFILTIPFWGDIRLQGIARIPVYILGLYAGSMFCNQKEITKKTYKISLIISLIGALALITTYTQFYEVRKYYGLIFYSMLLFAPGFTLFLGFLFGKLGQIKFLKNIPIQVLEFIGKRSLEIYMLDAMINTFFKDQFSFVVHFSLSLSLGITYHFLFNSFQIRCCNIVDKIFQKKEI